MNRLWFYQRLALVSVLVVALLSHFAFGWLAFFVPSAKAAAINWVGGASGDWDDPENWSSGELPTSDDDVLIASTTALTITVPLGTTIDFANLTIDGSVIVTSSSIAQTAVNLIGDIGTGGNITLTGTNNSSTTHLANSPSVKSGVLRQYNTNTQTISGDLVIESGGFLWTSFNHEEHVYGIDFVAENIDVQFGGRVSAAGTGYTGGTLADRDGEGPGGGVYGTGPNSSGASHAGSGGTDTQGDTGGIGYCNFEDPSSIGSGGAASETGISPAGGGQVRLSANNELTIDGQIYAYGPSKAVGAGGSGGGGGSITLSGQNILGTPQFIDAFGGNGRGNTSTVQMSGGGGGGCVKISYGTSNALNPLNITVHGGGGYQQGGAGTVFLHKQDDSVRHLYVSNSSTPEDYSSDYPAVILVSPAAETVQSEEEHSFQKLSINTSSIYTIGSGKTLILTDNQPFEGSSTSGTIRIEDGGILKLDASAMIENITIQLHEGGMIVDNATDLSSTLDLTIGAGVILDMRDFTTTSEPFELGSLTVGSGGVVTHGSHEGLGNIATHMVYIEAANITIESGGIIDVSAKGFSGGDSAAANGYGPGGATYVFGDGSGGGHCGDGSMIGLGGGASYCDMGNLATLGSGGAAADVVSSTIRGGYGGNGGGLVWMSARETLTIDGEINASGQTGVYFSGASDASGGGSGGGIKLMAGVVTGTPDSISVAGGWQSLAPCDDCELSDATGGGGGGVLVAYTSESNMTSTTVDLSAGGAGDWEAEDGVFNSAPLISGSSIIPQLPVLMGQTLVSSTTNVSPFQIKVANEYAYIVSALTTVSTGNTRGIYIADISDPYNPTIVQSIVSTTVGSRIDISGDYLYTTNGLWSGTSNQVGSFQVIDISDPLNPVLLGNIVSSTQLAFSNDVHVLGNYAFVITGSSSQSPTFSGVRVVDISDPNNPAIVANFSDSDYLYAPLNMRVVGDYLYAAAGGSDSVQVIDISNPLELVAVGSIQDESELSSINKIAVKGEYAYVTSFTGDFLRVIDVSDPTNMQIVGGINGEIDGPNAISILGDYAYVSGQIDDGIYMIDISNPVSSTIIHTVTSTRLDGTRSSFIQDGYLYTAGSVNSGSEYFSVFDLNQPTLSFQTEDLDKTTLSAKVEYVTGSCVYSAGTYATFSTSTVTSTYGAVSINNSAGDNRRIQNISAANNNNNVTSTWLTTTDIPGTEGEYCMFVTAYDGLSESERATSTITIDLASVSPDTPELSFTKNQTSITLLWDDIAGTDYYTISSTISDIPTETSENSVTFAGLDDDTTFTFQIRATDRFENESAYSSPLNITTDLISPGGSNPVPEPPGSPQGGTTTTTPSSTPNNPSGLILINNGEMYTRSHSVMLFFNSSFVDSYALSPDGDFAGKSYAPIVSSTPYTLSAGEGEKKVYARFVNQFGVYEAFDVILVDSIPPLVPIFGTISSELTLNQDIGKYVRRNTSSTELIKPMITGTAEPGSRIVITLISGVSVSVMRLAQIQVFYATADNNGNWSFIFPINFDNTAYTLRIQSEDSAGNISEPTEAYIDLSVPETPPPCTVDCEPVEEPPIDPPCTVDCEPIDPPVEEDPPCTVDCEGEVEVPVDTGTGEGTTEEEIQETAGETTSGGSSTFEEESGADSKTVVENVTDSVEIVTDVVTTFFVELGESIQQIPGVEAITTAAGVVIEKTQQIIDDPVVESANEIVVVPIVTVVSTVNVAAGGASLLAQIMAYIRLIFSQPLLLLKRRHQKKWGVVFNAYTKRPLDLAMVRLIDANTNHIIRTQVTDTQGRFFMNALAGNYTIEILKEGFRMQTTGIKEDSTYPNIYRGGDIAVTEDKFELNYNIPLEPALEKKTTKHLISEYSKAGVQKSVSTVGVIATAGSLFISPKPWITLLLILHLVLYLCIKRFSRRKIKGTHAVVTNSVTKKPIGKVLIRVFDATYNKLVDSTMSDMRGRYAVLVGPSTYYITAEKEGFLTAQSEIIDLSSEKTNGVGGVIAENISLLSNIDKTEKSIVTKSPLSTTVDENRRV